MYQEYEIKIYIYGHRAPFILSLHLLSRPVPLDEDDHDADVSTNMDESSVTAFAKMCKVSFKFRPGVFKIYTAGMDIIYY